MFGIFFKKKQPETNWQYVVAQLNAKIQPMHRGEFFEDPLDVELKKLSIGQISGGGTMQESSGEIAYCDIEIQVYDSSEDNAQEIIKHLEKLGAPKKSKLKIEATGKEIEFGVTEGLAVYLNGTDLDEEIYQNCDSNVVYSELDKLLTGEGRVLSYWQGNTETALYLYGKSYDEMKAKISDFLASYPLCQKCRVVQIA